MSSTEVDKPQAGATQQTEANDYRKNFNYPLVKYTDMSEEMKAESVDLIVTGVEKFMNNYETIKESLDKKFGTSWHVVVGEGYAFEISYDVKHLIYVFYGGIVGILAWKASK